MRDISHISDRVLGHLYNDIFPISVAGSGWNDNTGTISSWILLKNLTVSYLFHVSQVMAGMCNIWKSLQTVTDISV